MDAVEAVIFFFIFAPGILLVVAFVLDVMSGRDRAKRIEEAIPYNPEPVHPVTRFCGGDEMRKRGW
jgi:hypothetical protein